MSTNYASCGCGARGKEIKRLPSPTTLKYRYIIETPSGSVRHLVETAWSDAHNGYRTRHIRILT